MSHHRSRNSTDGARGTSSSGEAQRRGHERYNIYLPIVFFTRGLEGEVVSGRGTTINIGEGGTFFACRTNGLKPGMRLELMLFVESALIRAGAVSLTGTVVRVCPLKGLGGNESAGNGVAVKFDRAWETISILAPE